MTQEFSAFRGVQRVKPSARGAWGVYPPENPLLFSLPGGATQPRFRSDSPAQLPDPQKAQPSHASRALATPRVSSVRGVSGGCNPPVHKEQP